MAYFSTEPASERRNVTGKNRVWDFFRLSNETHPASRRQPAQPRRKIRPTPTKPASGIPYWPSRDPIEEEGGLNLYGFVRNDGVARFDDLGLDGSFVGQHPPRHPPALEKAFWDTQVRYYTASHELPVMISKLLTTVLDKKCDLYKAAMLYELNSANYNVHQTVLAIQQGKFTSIDLEAPSSVHGNSAASAPHVLYMCLGHVMYGNKSGIGTVANTPFTGRISINADEYNLDISDNDMSYTKRTIFHEMSHIGAGTLDGSDYGLSNDAEILSILSDSIDKFVYALHTDINGVLESECKCWYPLWWK